MVVKHFIGVKSIRLLKGISMSEEENIGVVAQATEEIAQSIESETTQEAQNEAQKVSAAKRNDVEYNWAEMRERQRRLERENEELKQGFAKLNQPKQEPQEEDYGFKDDDLIEGKHVKSIMKEIKNLKNELKQKEASTVDDRIQFKFPDYREVVTKENIELLKETEPVLVKSLLSLSDPYEQAEAAYRMLKKMAPTAKEPSNTLEKKKALENAQKPLSVQAVAKTSSIAEANQFAEMDSKTKQAFLRSKYEEMQKAMRSG